MTIRIYLPNLTNIYIEKNKTTSFSITYELAILKMRNAWVSLTKENNSIFSIFKLNQLKYKYLISFWYTFCFIKQILLFLKFKKLKFNQVKINFFKTKILCVCVCVAFSEQFLAKIQIINFKIIIIQSLNTQ